MNTYQKKVNLSYVKQNKKNKQRKYQPIEENIERLPPQVRIPEEVQEVALPRVLRRLRELHDLQDHLLRDLWRGVTLGHLGSFVKGQQRSD